jgi:hypothetical protein
MTKAPTSNDETDAEACVSSDGTFGNISLKTIQITNLYEMQTVAGVDKTQIENEILPSLEKVIVDSILHELFPENCAATAIGKRRRELQRSLNDESLKVIGVSMYPPDDITTNTACEVLSSSDSTSECFVLKGNMTIYLDEDQIVEEEQIIQKQESVGNVIKENMNSGVYDEASDDILRLHYLEKRDPTASNVSDANDGDKQVKSRNRSLRIGLFVGIGTLTAVLAGVIFRLTRRMRNNDDQTELQNSAVQTYLDVEEQRPSFS